jgi:hypothetical protein
MTLILFNAFAVTSVISCHQRTSIDRVKNTKAARLFASPQFATTNGSWKIGAVKATGDRIAACQQMRDHMSEAPRDPMASQEQFVRLTRTRSGFVQGYDYYAEEEDGRL